MANKRNENEIEINQSVEDGCGGKLSETNNCCCDINNLTRRY